MRPRTKYPRVIRVAAILDGVVTRVAHAAAWLVLAVVVALYAQMPMRDLVGRNYLILNDYGQLFHATVFLIGIPYAIVADRHVRFDVLRERYPPRVRATIETLGHLLFVLPWAYLLADFGFDRVFRSITLRETFPDTGNPGFWLMAVAYVIFVVLLFMASIARLLVSLHDSFAKVR